MHGEYANAFNNFVGKPEGMRPSGRPMLDRRIILKIIFGKLGWLLWIESV